jgi:hypothetical protein
MAIDLATISSNQAAKAISPVPIAGIVVLSMIPFWISKLCPFIFPCVSNP